jgi:3-oxoacyl-[acyl-carrier protein] reductase
MTEAPRFAECRVVVTGASRGLGRATALAFARQGAHVAILARSSEGLSETAGQGPLDCPLLAMPTDLTRHPSVVQSADEILRQFGRVDVLVHNAAGWVTGALDGLDPATAAEIVLSTVVGAMWLTQRLLPGLRASKHACIINVASTAALPGADPAHSSVAFVAAKRGLVGFGEALGTELRPQGIGVTNLYPGAFHSDSPLAASAERVRRDFGPEAMGAADVVDAILFCASRSPLATVETLVLRETVPGH